MKTFVRTHMRNTRYGRTAVRAHRRDLKEHYKNGYLDNITVKGAPDRQANVSYSYDPKTKKPETQAYESRYGRDRVVGRYGNSGLDSAARKTAMTGKFRKVTIRD